MFTILRLFTIRDGQQTQAGQPERLLVTSPAVKSCCNSVRVKLFALTVRKRSYFSVASQYLQQPPYIYEVLDVLLDLHEKMSSSHHSLLGLGSESRPTISSYSRS